MDLLLGKFQFNAPLTAPGHAANSLAYFLAIMMLSRASL